MIERNLRLVVYIARKFENTGISIEDLISIGAIGLIKAVNSFDPDKNIKLATYASRCIENEILMVLRKTSRHEAGGLLRRAAEHRLGRQRAAAFGCARHRSRIWVSRDLDNAIEKEMLYSAINEPEPARERHIVNLRYGLGRRKGAYPEGSRRHDGYFAELHITPRKAHH